MTTARDVLSCVNVVIITRPSVRHYRVPPLPRPLVNITTPYTVGLSLLSLHIVICRLSVRLSLCSTHSGVVSKSLNISSKFAHSLSHSRASDNLYQVFHALWICC